MFATGAEQTEPISLVTGEESLWCRLSFFLFDGTGLVDEAQESNDALCTETWTQHQLERSSCMKHSDQSEGTLQNPQQNEWNGQQFLKH